MTSAPLKAHDE